MSGRPCEICVNEYLLMKNPLLLLIPLAIAIATIGARLQPLPPRLDTNALMKSKLVASQKVLEGIATEDFALIQRSATLLYGYSQTAEWAGQQPPEYNRFTTDFRRQASALVQAGRDKNVDRATVAYFQLTVSCVNCHKFLREHRP
jgi:hypothetical protein